MHYDTLPRNYRLLPRETWSSETYERPTQYATLPASLHGVWETVQPSAQRVQSHDQTSTRSFEQHDRFSDLGIYNEYINQNEVGRKPSSHENIDGLARGREMYENDFSRGRYISPNSIQRRERYIPIPIEHVKTVQKPKTPYDMSKTRRPVYGRENSFSPQRPNGAWRQNSCEVIDLSDDTEEEESLSDEDSDCDIYPFTLRNMNNNTKKQKSKALSRSEPYSLRKSSSPEKDSNAISSSSLTCGRPLPYTLRHLSNPSVETSLLSHSNNRRSKQSTRPPSNYRERSDMDRERDVVYLSDDSYCSSKMSEKLKTAPLSSRIHHQSEDSFHCPQGSSGRRLKSCHDKQSYTKFEDKYDLIENDKESAFSNNGYQFSDEENGVISIDDFEFDKGGTSRKKTVDSRKSSDSDYTDNGIVKTPSYPAYNIIRDMIEPEERQVDYIRGDGNCLFRALSKIIYNTESCHEEIRQAVVDLMEKFPKDFEQFIDGKSIHLHIISMRKDGTWGTQAEIYGAATLLQRDIYILSPDPLGKQYRWLLFSPRFEITDVDSYDSCYITLCHTNGNHYDRIAPLIGRCNCHLMPPELSGVKDEVDLTSGSDDLSSVVV